MQHNILIAVFLVFAVAIAGVAIWLFGSDDSEGDGHIPADGRVVEERSGEPAPVERNRGYDSDPERQLFEDEADAAVQDESIPSSYRQLLGTVTGRLVEVDGTPIPGIHVEAFGASILDFFPDTGIFTNEESQQKLNFKTDESTTAEDGTFRLTGLEPRAFHVLGFDIGGPRPTARFLDAAPGPGETVDLGDIVLSACSVIFGTVVDSSGEPIQGARVRTTELPPIIFISGVQDYRKGCSFLIRDSSRNFVFNMPAAFASLAERLPFPTTYTDAEGKFRLEGVPLGLHTVIVDREEFISSREGPVGTGDGGEHDVGAIVLHDGVALKGKVVDLEGRPVPDVDVRAGPLYGVAEFIILKPLVKSNEKGEFVVKGMPNLAAFAAARRFEEDPWTVVGPFDPELEPPTLVLPPAFDLRVVVKDEEGANVDGVKLKIRNRVGDFDIVMMHPLIVPRERIDYPEKGVIDVKGLPDGRYELLLHAPGYGARLEEVRMKGDAQVKEITLKTAFQTGVVVLREKDKSPVEWADVNITRGKDFWFDPIKLSRAKTDASGHASFSNLSPGQYKVTASHPLYAFTAGELKVPETEETVLLMKESGVLEGVVHRAGSPHEAPFMIAAFPRGVDSPATATMRFTATDLDGKFRITHLSPGRWRASVLKRLLDKDPLDLIKVMETGPLKEKTVEIVSGETTFVELNLAEKEVGPTGSVTGAVTMNGKPAAGATVNIWAKRQISATVGTTGLFELGQVPVGEHTLRISSLPGTAGYSELNLSRRIKVEENLPTEALFEVLTGAVEGQVVYERDGSPAKAVKVRVTTQERKGNDSIRIRAVTGLDGRFHISGVPEGVYKVESSFRELPCLPVSDVRVEYGGVADPVRLVLVQPASVSGRVILPDNIESTRWLGLSIDPTDRDGDSKWISVDAATGEFETDQLIPGSYKATLYGQFPDGASFDPMEFDVPRSGISGLVLTPVRK